MSSVGRMTTAEERSRERSPYYNQMSAEEQQRDDRRVRVLEMYDRGEIPQDTLGQIVSDNSDGDLRDAVDRGWITSQQANTISGKQMIIPVPASSVHIDGENQYVASNGRRPAGNGNWAFEIGGKEVWITGTYANAKKEAKKRAGRLGFFSARLLT